MKFLDEKLTKYQVETLFENYFRREKQDRRILSCCLTKCHTKGWRSVLARVVHRKQCRATTPTEY